MSEIAKIIETQRFRCSCFCCRCVFPLCFRGRLWYVCAYVELIDFCWKTNEILLKCSICTFCIRNAMGNQLKTITTTANWLLNLWKHFSEGVKMKFLYLFLAKIKWTFILLAWQISCQKGGLVYFPNIFKYLCEMETLHSITIFDTVIASTAVKMLAFLSANQQARVRCVCKFSGKQTSMDLINKFHCTITKANLKKMRVFFPFNKMYLSLCNWQRNACCATAQGDELLQIQISLHVQLNKSLLLFNKS